MPENLGEGGVYFDPESPASTADAVENTIDSRDLRSAIRALAKTLSKQFS